MAVLAKSPRLWLRSWMLSRRVVEPLDARRAHPGEVGQCAWRAAACRQVRTGGFGSLALVDVSARRMLAASTNSQMNTTATRTLCAAPTAPNAGATHPREKVTVSRTANHNWARAGWA